MKRKKRTWDVSAFGGDVTVVVGLSDLGERKVIEGVGYSPEVWAANKEALSRPTERNPGLPSPLEHDEQARLFAKADANTDEYPMLALLFAIPNGQYRDGQRMEPGLKCGVPDIFLPIQFVRMDAQGFCTRHYAGLFIELKRSDHSYHPSVEQEAWMFQLERNGYKCVVAYGADEAWKSIIDYVEGGKRETQ